MLDHLSILCTVVLVRYVLNWRRLEKIYRSKNHRFCWPFSFQCVFCDLEKYLLYEWAILQIIDIQDFQSWSCSCFECSLLEWIALRCRSSMRACRRATVRTMDDKRNSGCPMLSPALLAIWWLAMGAKITRLKTSGQVGNEGVGNKWLQIKRNILRIRFWHWGPSFLTRKRSKVMVSSMFWLRKGGCLICLILGTGKCQYSKLLKRYILFRCWKR